MTTYNREYYLANRQTFIKRQMAFDKKHIKRRRANQNRYYHAHKELFNERHRKWCKANKKHLAEYYAKNREKIKAQCLAWYHKNKGKRSYRKRKGTYDKEYYAKNREKIIKRVCAYGAKHKEEHAKSMRNYYLRNKKKFHANSLRYYYRHREKRIEYQKRYHARKKLIKALQ